MIVALIFIFLVHKTVKAGFDSELLSRVAISFAQDYYYVTCIVSLYSEKLSAEEKNEIFKAQKILIAKSYKTCGIYSFEKYIALRSSKNFQFHEKSCSKPLKLVFVTREGKEQFTDVRSCYLL